MARAVWEKQTVAEAMVAVLGGTVRSHRVVLGGVVGSVAASGVDEGVLGRVAEKGSAGMAVGLREESREAATAKVVMMAASTDPAGMWL